MMKKKKALPRSVDDAHLGLVEMASFEILSFL